ncbi:GIY-YIG nuclease family protein [Saccharicrinis fermentans]|uniref:T5orf172 domain protein n=1 Tax=Saccharicrinis fermentans DSM 9555 = JCM 21142 TaxID=869213 RepID=W7Y3Z3_9BACT|nr:GIY-YIG nuclease family protein [Saccharicrinis fermentans]GAF05570.1 T5orf172 domain protein [Saccharicrinis fermentans DSM 9555 = JCM 21142]
MDKDSILDEIFSNDPLGLLNVKPKKSNARTADERLLANFQEINDFVKNNSKEPEPNPSNISEYQLYSRLKSLREDLEKVELLKLHDTYNLLPDVAINQVNESQGEYNKPKEINSIEDLFGDDSLNILGGDDAGLFDFKHTPKDYERAHADFIARRKTCKDFGKYEQLLKDVQKDLAEGKRKLIDFKQDNLQEMAFYVHNGVLFYLEKINISHKEHYKEDGTRVREDGRTRCIFENGTESNMLKRSVEKILYANGRVVTENIDKVNEGFLESFSTITEEDEEAGYIYVLMSKSTDERISAIQELFKVGYSKTDVEERIKNAEKEPTYLMAPVRIKGAWKCFNMNPQKLEQLLHNFFGNSCLEIDVFDEKGKRHTPREWFIAPFEVIEQAIELIINGKIVKYRYDEENGVIVLR